MEIGNYDQLFSNLKDSPFEEWGRELKKLLPARFDIEKDGNLPRWIEAMKEMPEPSEWVGAVENGYYSVGTEESIDCSREEMTSLLKKFMPWRKGPWKFAGIPIDTEWHSDWKWERVAPHLSSLRGRSILDVGSGNGYYGYRMALEGAERVIGIDPGMLAVVQYTLMKRYQPSAPVWVLPLGIEDMPEKMSFDTVFSMGVLYHRRSPIDHLFQLRSLLRRKGELVLETIVVDESYGNVLVPEGRYQQMRNVWFLPSVTELEIWLHRCGFKNIRTVSVSDTTIEEQRSTEWMQFDSLEKFLDPHDHSKTIEGYPAPKRAVIIAEAP